MDCRCTCRRYLLLPAGVTAIRQNSGLRRLIMPSVVASKAPHYRCCASIAGILLEAIHSCSMADSHRSISPKRSGVVAEGDAADGGKEQCWPDLPFNGLRPAVQQARRRTSFLQIFLIEEESEPIVWLVEQENLA